MATKKSNAPKQKNPEAQAKAHANRLRVLNETVVDVCDRIGDNPARSYTGRAIKARSVDPSVVEVGFAAIETALADARAKYAAAQRNDDAARVARVDLTTA